MASDQLLVPRDQPQRDAYQRILQHSYGYDAKTCERWLHEAGEENARVLLREPARTDARVVGGLLRLPMGQFFGGRRLTTCGITAVAIGLAARGRGTATHLMRQELTDLAEHGFLLSTLWGASESLYRRVGYAVAGGYYRVSVQARDLHGGHTALPMRNYEEADEPAVRALYQRFARTRTGWLDRGSYCWGRTRQARQRRFVGYVVEDERLVGYCFLRHEPTEHGYNVELSDLAYENEDAARTLLAFLASQRSLGERVSWLMAPDDGILSLITNRHHQLQRPFTWMLRVLNVPKALGERGYPHGLSGSLCFEVEDDVIESNNGRFVLEVEDGRGRVRSGGNGNLRLDVSALAALFTGHHSALRLLETGRLKGDMSSIRLASSLFSGPAPSCGDYF